MEIHTEQPVQLPLPIEIVERVASGDATVIDMGVIKETCERMVAALNDPGANQDVVALAETCSEMSPLVNSFLDIMDTQYPESRTVVVVGAQLENGHQEIRGFASGHNSELEVAKDLYAHAHVMEQAYGVSDEDDE